MTREEAIHILKDSKPSTNMKEGKVFDRVASVCIAIDMAIKALQEQKVGKWRTEVDYGNHLHCYCPFCRHEGLGVRQKYCYECGAKMEGADNE